MTPAVEIYEKVLADVDHRDVQQRLTTISAIAEGLEKRKAVVAATRHAARPTVAPLPPTLAASQNEDGGFGLPQPSSALPETMPQSTTAKSLKDE